MAAVSAAEAAKLGAELTPLGAEKAGNADGSIPAWDGGLTSAAQAGVPELQAGPASPGSVRERQAAVHDHRGEHGSVREQADRGPQEAAADVQVELQDARVPDASQRRLAAAHLRRDQAHRDHRRDREGRQWRREGGRRHSVPDSEVGRRGVLESRAALSRRRDRAQHRPGAGDRERFVHDGEVPRRDHGGLQPGGREVGEPRQHDRVLHPGDDGARAPRG